MKRGLGAHEVLKRDIELAQLNTHSAAEAARYLDMSYNTYKKHAKLHGIWKIREKGTKTASGLSTNDTIERSKAILDKILNGEYPKYNRHKFKMKLIRHGLLKEKCDECGMDEKRITDNRVPLMLVYMDENQLNFALENLRLVCFNCHFLIYGNLNGPKKSFIY